MPYYHTHEMVIHSEVILDLPSAIDREQVDCDLIISSEFPFSSIPPRPFRQHRMPDGAVWLELAHHPFGYHLRFPALADFLVSTDGTEIRCAPCPGVPDHTIEHLLLDQVLPHVLSHQGRTVLHASAVRHGEHALAFVGEAGRGKSTLTASFCQMGLALITDDCLLLAEDGAQVLGVGSYPGLRLWPDSLLALGERVTDHEHVSHYSSKRRLGPENAAIRFHDQPLPVRCVYLLDQPQPDDDTIRIEPLAPTESVISLLECSFRLDITDRERNAREFETLSRLAQKLPIFRLRYPRRYDLLPSVQQAVLGHSASIG